MERIETDVLVVGSGFGGAAPALRLAEAGFRVVVVEKGPSIDPSSDFRQTQDPQYLTRFLKNVDSPHLKLTYAEALGGGSGFYEMVSLRAPSLVFESADAAGEPLWPGGFARASLDPWYERAERMLSVEQIAEEDVPKTGQVFARLMRNLGYSADRARYAVQGCRNSGFCVTGCVFGAKQSLLLNYLPQAVAAGARIETGLAALSIEHVGEERGARTRRPLRGVAYRYRVICGDPVRRAPRLEVRARIVVLGGGTVGTADLLLRSRAGLPMLSDQVGRHLVWDAGVKVAALLPDGFPDADMFVGRSHPGMVSYEFLASHGMMVTAVKALPIQLAAGARLRRANGGDDAWWGPENVDLMRRYRHRVIVLVAFGSTPPPARLALDAKGAPRLLYTLTPEARAYYARHEGILVDILRRNGCEVLSVGFLGANGEPCEGIRFSTAHQLGSCRMAGSKLRGVCDTRGEVFDYPGLYVTDGAAIPSSVIVNPSLTILANAERVASGIVARHAV